MIVDALIEIVTVALTGLLGLLPTEPEAPDLAGKFDAAFGGLQSMLGALGDWFPLDELATCLGIIMAWAVVIHLVKLTAWILAVLHVSGSDG